MSLKKYKITINKFIHDNELEFEEKRIIDIMNPDSYSIKEDISYFTPTTLDTFISDYMEGWNKSSNNYWFKKKGNVNFDVYENDEKWYWKVKLNNAGIDYTTIERGITDSLNSAIKLCNDAYVNRVKTF
jgi:hypothetical protein